MKKNSVPLTNVELASRIFDQYGEFIQSVIRFNVRDEALQDDLFQDFFLFFVSKPVPENIENIKGFLYKVVSNRIKDTFGSMSSYQIRIHKYAEMHEHVTNTRPDSILSESEEMNKMFALIERHLSPTEAQAVSFRYRNGYDNLKAAQKMGVKVKSVSRYVSIGLNKVRNVLIGEVPR